MEETLDLEVAAAAFLLSFAYFKYVYTYKKTKVKKPWRRRRWWMKTIHRNRTRQSMENMLNELLIEPSGEFENFTRMSYSDFEYLLDKVSPVIGKNDTQLRLAIPAKLRLAITLRYLATGDSFKSLHYLFKVSSEIISRIIPDVCKALNSVLEEKVKMPCNADEWLEIEKGFSNNFPHAIGSIDGKHVVIFNPPHSGSDYFNYKKTFSIVLLAVVNSKYQFIFADIGSQGRISDGGVLRNSVLWDNICDNKLNLPTARPLPGSNIPVPYVFLGDGAFALSTHIMKPFPGDHEYGSVKRIFNDRLSRSRVIVENTFGILSARFRVFRKPIALTPEKVTLITMTSILLHNFLMNSQTSRPLYNPPGTMDQYDGTGRLIQEGNWRQVVDERCAIRPTARVGRRPAITAQKIRDEFANYFANNV